MASESARQLREALLTEMAAAARRNHEADLRDTTNGLSATRRELSYLARDMESRQRQHAELRAKLRQLEAAPPTDPDPEAVAEDIRFIRSLPGVLFFGLRDEKLVVEFRTTVLYQKRAYDLGDFELPLGNLTFENSRFIYMRCTRLGTLPAKDPYDSRRSRFYWYPTDPYSDGLGDGRFCTGSRTSDIAKLYQSGSYGTMVHLLIATMCGINEGHWDELPYTFQSKRVSRERRRNWKFGYHPNDTPASASH